MSNPEEDPTLEVTFGGEPFEVNRRNSFLYTYLGGLSMYDHVFVMHDEEAGRGWYVFKEHMPEGYALLGNFMLQNMFTMHVNMQDVAQGDIDAWNHVMFSDLNEADTLPDTWEQNGAA